jgi:hypothetical protein
MSCFMNDRCCDLLWCRSFGADKTGIEFACADWFIEGSKAVRNQSDPHALNILNKAVIANSVV